MFLRVALIRAAVPVADLSWQRRMKLKNCETGQQGSAAIAPAHIDPVRPAETSDLRQ